MSLPCRRPCRLLIPLVSGYVRHGLPDRVGCVLPSPSITFAHPRLPMTAVDSRHSVATRSTRPRRTARQTVSGYRRADQAAHHRAAAGHHRADDVPGRGRGALALAGRRDADRRVDGRRQREHPELLSRPRHRHGHASHRAAPAGHRPGEPARGPRVRRRCSARPPWPGWPPPSAGSPRCSRSRRSRSTSGSTRWRSSGARRRTSCGAAPPAACRC